MVNTIVETVVDRNQFLNQLLPSNEGLILIKFGATWCKPCQLIKPIVTKQVSMWPETVKCYSLDVDDNFDIYAYFKNKRMINGIPVILAYKKGNNSFVPDLSVTGANSGDLQKFFFNCTTILNSVS